ncbi:magnetosome protein MamO [Magnetospirillum gryphiswaldense]|uniref:Probable membrane transporter protein MamO n=2 Tax=Alphaproteobacteria TaxID=28211 RepID=MAMO_MAGGM|nr:magnetosome protein MamO [Magnetospirillum gryphiswaldense]Q93DZ1.1 RecName: Full=Probable membrane transporter protein MamO [Magnetospirillum gryphiswaldense MSR-1]AAL09994.1 unknown [Magnetospirillum gryphiswaldense MSR-1]AVM72856.1 magnetosome membrane protein MamO [Magnetospirillum gryphiswaldense MSR-1]AVM76759.1 magnetosome membrane protein MamO [Magnetospirillum gryphiswaldense]CAE12038.1 mamO [Magnetospirillum gryphiswaldense]CAJ30122.1 magnetosome protein MamO [Magnetospirillum gr
MIEIGETMGDQPTNKIVFCERSWKAPVSILAFLILVTFAWGAYLLDNYDEDDYFRGSDDMSVGQFLVRNVAMPDVQRLYYTVPPAVVGVGGGGVNAGPVASGAIVGANGYVITTLHSVANVPDITVQVATSAGIRRFPAQVVKTIPGHNLALLKLQTTEKFLHFRMANIQTVVPGQQVFAFGRNMAGAPLVRQGMVQSSDAPLAVGTTQITHLLRSDAVYSWEQTGGPLVNAQGDLVGINIAATGPTGKVEGFTVPAQVIVSHLQDVVRFKTGGAAGVAPPAAQTVAMGSSSWWSKAKAVVGGPTAVPGMGMNVVQGTVTTGIPSGMPFVDTDHVGGAKIGGYSIADILGLGMLALAAGVTGGMMTMGGGVLQVAGMMVFFGYGMYLIRPVVFLTNVVVYGAAALRNDKAQLVQWDKVKPLIPWGVAGVVIGYFIGNAIGDSVVGVLLGLFALIMAGKAVLEILQPNAGEDTAEAIAAAEAGDEMDELMALAEGTTRPKTSGIALPEGPTRSAVLGLPMGLFSGILGISGGVIEVPLQRYIGRISLQNAIANSSVLVFWASVAGSVVAFIHGGSTGLIHWEAPVTLALVMIPGAYVGGILGARLMRVLPVRVLKGIYAATMAAIAIKMLTTV